MHFTLLTLIDYIWLDEKDELVEMWSSLNITWHKWTITLYLGKRNKGRKFTKELINAKG